MRYRRWVSLFGIAALVGVGCGDDSVMSPDADPGVDANVPDGSSDARVTDGSSDADSAMDSRMDASRTYQVRGAVTGLRASTELRLRFEDESELALDDDGPFESTVGGPAAPSYEVRVVAQPEGQACTLTPGEVVDGDLNNVDVQCDNDTDGDGIGDTIDDDDDDDGWSDEDELACGDGAPLDASVQPLDNDEDGVCDTLDVCRLDGTDECETRSPFRDCFDISRATGFVTPSGAYWVQPDADDMPMQVYCEMSIDGGGWTLVIHQDTRDTWADWNHNFDPAAQSGTYVAAPIGDGEFYLPHEGFLPEASAESGDQSLFSDESQYLFASGDLEDWLVTRPDALRLDERAEPRALPAYTNALRRVDLDSATPVWPDDPIEYRWFFRNENGEDPWISLGDHPLSDESTSVMLYGEDGTSAHTARGKERSGMNVFVRRARPPEQVLGFDEPRCWFEASVPPDADPDVLPPEVTFASSGCDSAPVGANVSVLVGRSIATLELGEATYFAAGFPAAGRGAGRVNVYRQDADGALTRLQSIVPSDHVALESFEEFGHHVTMVPASESAPDVIEGYLIVAAPGTAANDGGFAAFVLTDESDEFDYFTSYIARFANGRLGESLFSDGTLIIAGAPADLSTAGYLGTLNLESLVAGNITFPTVPSPTIGQLGPGARCGVSALITRSPRRVFVGCPEGIQQVEQVDPSTLLHQPSFFIPRPGDTQPGDEFGASMAELTLPTGHSVIVAGSPGYAAVEDGPRVGRVSRIGLSTVYRVFSQLESPVDSPLGFGADVRASYPFVAVFAE